MQFTVEEENLICMYHKSDRRRTAAKTAQRQKKPSIRAQLKAAKEEQAKKPPVREKSKELEV